MHQGVPKLPHAGEFTFPSQLPLQPRIWSCIRDCAFDPLRFDLRRHLPSLREIQIREKGHALGYEWQLGHVRFPRGNRQQDRSRHGSPGFQIDG